MNKYKKALQAADKYMLQVRAIALTAENPDIAELLDTVADGYEAATREAR